MKGDRSRRLATVTTLGLLAALAWQLSRLTWLLVPPPAEEAAVTAPAPPAEAPAAANAGERAHDYARIADWHLLGKADEKASSPLPKAPVDAPETRLALTLRGVLASDSPTLARAIIASARGEEKMYKVGDRLPGNAELVRILPDRVILRRGGRHETLHLPRETAPARPLAVGWRRHSNAAGGNAAPEAGAILRRYRDAIRTNPRSLIELVRPIPATRDHRFDGFRVFPGSRPELFRKLGLRPGDLVTEVNGIRLDSPARGIEVLRKLGNADRIRLHIRRGQREMELSFRLS